MPNQPTDREAQAKARIEHDPRLRPHANTLLHERLMTAAHSRFLSTHHRSQLIGLAKTLENLELLDDD